MGPLDGKTPITPTAFDAHEQVVRQPHTHSLEDGYQPDTEFEATEYPKAVDHVEGEPVVVNSPKEEKAYKAAKAAEATQGSAVAADQPKAS